MGKGQNFRNPPSGFWREFAGEPVHHQDAKELHHKESKADESHEMRERGGPSEHSSNIKWSNIKERGSETGKGWAQPGRDPYGHDLGLTCLRAFSARIGIATGQKSYPSSPLYGAGIAGRNCETSRKV